MVKSWLILFKLMMFLTGSGFTKLTRGLVTRLPHWILSLRGSPHTADRMGAELSRLQRSIHAELIRSKLCLTWKLSLMAKYLHGVAARGTHEWNSQWQNDCTLAVAKFLQAHLSLSWDPWHPSKRKISTQRWRPLHISPSLGVSGQPTNLTRHSNKCGHMSLGRPAGTY